MMNAECRILNEEHAARGFGDFANDPSLSPFEIALIAAWADGDAPKGKRTSVPVRADAVASGFSRTTNNARETTRTLPCGTQPLSGRLLGIRPILQKSASAEITARLPDGRREILAWIRNFDPDFAETYWLRTPLNLPPRSRLSTVADGTCSIAATVGRPLNGGGRSRRSFSEGGPSRRERQNGKNRR